ncbi:MAG: suppressor of fused domain protein [Clostridia bacterium]|nr:suppressor of fused domain protein [Clostridia bacterium]
MLNRIAQRLLMAHYEEVFQPLNEPEFAERDSAGHPCAGLMVVRMLCRRPDGQLMQVLATIGASQHLLPRDPEGGEPRNEYVLFAPADWDLQDEKHQWLLDLLGDLADFTCQADHPLSYGHSIDMYTDPTELPEDVNMTGCMLLQPFGGKRPEVLTCRTGLFSKVSIIHAMPVTAEELKMSEAELNERFYPASGEIRFLCARKR